MKFSDFKLLDFGTKILLTGAVFTDGTKNYFFPYPATTDEEKLLPVELVDKISIDGWWKLIKQTDEQVVEAIRNEGGRIVKIMLKKGQRQIDNRIAWRCYRRDGFKCRYCGDANDSLTVDHIDLWEDGGATIDANLNTSCRKCNKTRSNMKYSDWLNSPYYLRVSQALTDAERQANQDIVLLLPTLETKRPSYVKSR